MAIFALRLLRGLSGVGFGWATLTLGLPVAFAQPAEPPIRPVGPEPPNELPDEPLPLLPPPDQLIPSLSLPTPPTVPANPDEQATFYIAGVDIVGNTALADDEFADLVAPYVGQQISFSDLLALRTAITDRYVERGFVTSGAFIPPQTVEADIVKIQVIEGEIEEIVVRGQHRLSEAYVRSRIGLSAQPPINVDTLLAGLQRLQNDPLIETISADLQAGVRPGTSLLVIDITEADSLAVATEVSNSRSPNIGGAERQFSISEGNLLGLGDRLALDYSNTDGSNGLDLSYTLPVSPNNDSLRFSAGLSHSEVIDSIFSVLEISSDSHYYELSYRHPLIESPTEELAMGLTLSYQESQTRLGIDDIGPFPLSPGANSDGITRVSTLRFFQEWTERSPKHVLALRSQFNLGVDWFGATDNDSAPDSEFFAWRGQGQWVQLIGRDTLFFLKGSAQLAADDLLSQEAFGLGGHSSVRGYRQDALLRDNGAALSAELRLPVARVPEMEGLLQVTPFVDVGAAWNYRDDPPGPNVLAGLGLGLLWQQGDRFSARLDWGIPLVDLPDDGSDSWQDNGLYFSIQFTPF
ncbi:MAG: ShlB/FhaC/HecB family hemolysin secretion/activation protein [Leptolyngbya sp. SIO4C1]|nr:ShlB/FhaC/HecB family hemolysin secretion/activation protein [Leptolyngbya sp. SIO4C1]